MERTKDLESLFHRALSTQSATKESTPSPSAAALPFLQALEAVHTSARKALASSSRRVTQIVTALDTCPLSTSKLESTVLLSEAELFSCSASTKELSESVVTMREQLLKDRERDARTSLVGGLGRRKLAGRAEDQVRVQLLEHVEEALRTLDKAVSNARLRVALCKEEIALYKNEMTYFSHAGVMQCDAATVALLEAASSVRGSSQANRTEDVYQQAILDKYNNAHKEGHPRDAAGSAAGRSKAGFGFIGDVSAQTKSMMGKMVHQANATLKQVRSQAADSALAAVLQTGLASTESILNEASMPILAGLLGDSASGISADLSNPMAAVRSTIQMLGGGGTRENQRRFGFEEEKAPVTEFTYTPAEAAALEQENVQLLVEQRETTAQDAKQIEASVRELSQLTSLANEKVLQQNEQFSVVLKNTEITKNNIDKAGKEVQEAEKSFWTSTKQLIALLWCCTVFICVSNFLIR